MFSKIVRVAMVATLALTLAGATAANAKGREVVKTGSCSGTSDWKLKLKSDNGKIELEYEVDSNRVGQNWQVRITKNGIPDLPGLTQDHRAERFLHRPTVDAQPCGHRRLPCPRHQRGHR